MYFYCREKKMADDPELIIHKILENEPEKALGYCLSRVIGEIEASLQILSGMGYNEVTLLIGSDTIDEWLEKVGYLEGEADDLPDRYAYYIKDYLDWRLGN